MHCALSAPFAANSLTTRWHSSYRQHAGWLVDSQRTPSTGPSRPASSDSWQGTWVPAVGKTLQGLLRIRQGGGTVDRPQVGRHGPAFFPRNILETIVDLAQF